MVATTVNLYDLGDVATVSAVFTDDGGTAADPTTVTASVRAPDNTVTAYTVTPGEIVKDSVGHYHLDIACTQSGDYFYRFVGVGAVTAARPGTFTVRPSTTVDGLLTPTALTTLGETRRYVLRDATDGSQDDQLADLINAYSAAVYAYTRREWLPQTNAAARKFAYTGGGFLSLEPYELRNLMSITMYTDLPAADQRILVAGSSTVESEFRLQPVNRTDEGTYQWLTLPQGTRGISSAWNNISPYGPVGRASPQEFEVTIMGDWGIGYVPDDVNLAVRIAVKDAYENPTGYASGIEGGLTFAEEPDAAVGPEARARNLPIESRALLSPYKRGSQVVTA